MASFLEAIVPAFVYIFIIMDPMASIPIFLTLTKKYKNGQMQGAATKAVLIAGALAGLFLLGGPELLDIMHITLSDFKIAGGIVLILLGLESVLGLALSRSKDGKESLSTISVLIATPLLTGPGLLTALVVLSTEQGMLIAAAAVALALLVSWIMLFNAQWIKNALGNQMLEIISKVFGLLILALGVAYVKGGLIG